MNESYVVQQTVSEAFLHAIKILSLREGVKKRMKNVW